MHLEYALDADAEFVLHCYTEKWNIWLVKAA